MFDKKHARAYDKINRFKESRRLCMSDNLSQALNPPPHAAEPPVSDKPYPFLDDTSPALCEAVKILQKSKTGRELLDCAAAYGTKINTECLNASFGSFNDETKQIFIAAGSNKNRMVITLAHELRHSQQFQNGVLLSAYADRPKDYLQSQGVIEADANVMACQVGWELQQQGINEPMEEFKKEDRDVVSAFLKAAEKGGVENGTAHGEAFYAWFNDMGLREAYEKNYIRNYERHKRKATREEEKTALQRVVPVADNIEKVCKFNGKTYLDAKEAREFFKKPEQNSVTHETYWAIYRNTRDALNLGFSKPAEEVIEMAGGLTEREATDWYCELPANLAKKQRLARRQKEASDKISHLRSLKSLDSIRTNGPKTPDLTTVALVRKKRLLQK